MEFGVHLPHIGPWHDGALAAMERFAKEVGGFG